MAIFEAIEALFNKYPGEFAAVMLEPMNTVEPPPGYLQGLKDLAHRHGALLIFDEIITGFRWSIGGAQARYASRRTLRALGRLWAMACRYRRSLALPLSCA